MKMVLKGDDKSIKPNFVHIIIQVPDFNAYCLCKLASTRRIRRKLSITICVSDNEEQQANKRMKMRHDRPSKTPNYIGNNVIRCRIVLLISLFIFLFFF